jgi:hypothetical protein
MLVRASSAQVSSRPSDYVGAVRDHALSLACVRQGLVAVRARGYDEFSRTRLLDSRMPTSTLSNLARSGQPSRGGRRAEVEKAL